MKNSKEKIGDYAICDNTKCIAYTEERCLRAIKHLDILSSGWASSVHLLKDTNGDENGECELYIPKDIK